MKNIESFNDLDFGCASAMDAKAQLKAGVGSFESDDPEQEHMLHGENPPKIDAIRIYQDIILPYRMGKGARPRFTAQDLFLNPGNMMGSSAKLDESLDWNWYTPGLYLASGRLSGYGDSCPYASDLCRENCLIVSGNRAMDKQVGNDEAKSALLISDLLNKKAKGSLGPSSTLSLVKSWLKEFNETEFFELLDASIQKNQNYAMNEHGRRKGEPLSYAVRLNATSDFAWENFGRWDMENDYPDVFFYDYTKNPKRMMKFLSEGPLDGRFDFSTATKFRKVRPHMRPSYGNPAGQPWPHNYYLCFSYSEVNLPWCLMTLKMGGNIVVPFDQSLGMIPPHSWEFNKAKVRKSELPETFLGYPVIDGDAYDMRFIDNEYWSKRLGVPPPYVVGLRVKGQYQNKEVIGREPRIGFFFSAVDAESVSDDKEWQEGCLIAATEECKRQTTARKFDSRTAPFGEGKGLVSLHEKLPSVEAFSEVCPELASAYKEAY